MVQDARSVDFRAARGGWSVGRVVFSRRGPEGTKCFRFQGRAQGKCWLSPAKMCWDSSPNSDGRNLASWIYHHFSSDLPSLNGKTQRKSPRRRCRGNSEQDACFTDLDRRGCDACPGFLGLVAKHVVSIQGGAPQWCERWFINPNN